MKLLTIGGLLVEIMRKNIDEPFTESHSFVGPFPSGDTPIFINEAAKLGNECTIIGTVGNDGFGDCIVNRLQESGVDTSVIKVKEGYTTGTAFVAYFGDGTRQFLYHWRHSAAGMITEEDIDAIDLTEFDWLHVTGITLAVNNHCKKAVERLIEKLPSTTTLSFDPNIRPEVLSAEEIRVLCEPIIKRSEYIFPSATEASMLTGLKDDVSGCKEWAKQGKTVILKNGEKGCIVFHKDEMLEIPSFKVEEVDPTGAGDTFCAGFVTAIGDGMSLYDAGRFANAAGALSVKNKGPMEGASTKKEVELFLKEQERTTTH
ncbi:sugar kinase [Sphaerochaeta halotolerans]|uniref:Sugar kinase n=1 Tax=Sphaerochaeta halotolerans TaxID=2293840 RepID=A0A372MK10_9SPIR|nr:sugar kinase [Sphaerochaeta halotolerans]RFU96099.1 sugar kinase [Sphaerochaeta halotolerans]